MRAMRTTSAIFAVLGLWIAPATAQNQNNQIERMDKMPIYRVNVVARTTKAINYRHRSGSTRVDFQGTALMPRAKGDAKVDIHQGYLSVDAHFKNMEPAGKYGPEYLTYVLWAITPEGRPKNLGEVVLNCSIDSKLDVTTDLQAFGLIVTAEPYFSVTMPSDVVVMENVIRTDTVGKIEEIDAKYELLPRGQYTLNIRASQLASANMKNQPSVSMEQYEAITTLYQARNAIQIARADGAEQAAGETLSKASGYLSQAEAAYARKNYKDMINTARHAVEAASDARMIAMRQKKDAAVQR